MRIVGPDAGSSIRKLPSSREMGSWGTPAGAGPSAPPALTVAPTTGCAVLVVYQPRPRRLRSRTAGGPLDVPSGGSSIGAGARGTGTGRAAHHSREQEVAPRPDVTPKSLIHEPSGRGSAGGRPRSVPRGGEFLPAVPRRGVEDRAEARERRPFLSVGPRDDAAVLGVSSCPDAVPDQRGACYRQDHRGIARSSGRLPFVTRTPTRYGRGPGRRAREVDPARLAPSPHLRATSLARPRLAAGWTPCRERQGECPSPPPSTIPRGPRPAGRDTLVIAADLVQPQTAVPRPQGSDTFLVASHAVYG
jgi:hypothetical protein